MFLFVYLQYPTLENCRKYNVDDTNADKNESRINQGASLLVQGSSESEKKSEDESHVGADNFGAVFSKIVIPDEVKDLESSCRDLLNRLLDCDPKCRLKLLLSLERIAMFKGFNFNAVRSRKVG